MTELKETVLYEKEGNIAWITFNRPEALNALNTEVNLALVDCLNRAEADQEVRVVILKGSGDKAFVAGADIKEMMTMSAMEARGFALKAKRVTDTIWNLKKPVIAAIQGFCLGGGLSTRWPAICGLPPRARKWDCPRSIWASCPAAPGHSAWLALSA